MFDTALTFGVSAVVSFLLSMVVLLAVAAKRGLLRAGTRPHKTLLLQHSTAAELVPKLPEEQLLQATPTAPPLEADPDGFNGNLNYYVKS